MLNFDKDLKISAYKLLENNFTIYNLMLKNIVFSIKINFTYKLDTLLQYNK